jgi:hypothetical protein
MSNPSALVVDALTRLAAVFAIVVAGVVVVACVDVVVAGVVACVDVFDAGVDVFDAGVDVFDAGVAGADSAAVVELSFLSSLPSVNPSKDPIPLILNITMTNKTATTPKILFTYANDNIIEINKILPKGVTNKKLKTLV